MKLGAIGETIAESYLLSKKWKILERNWFNSKGYRIGELDLIAEDCRGELVFVEIKTRKGRLGEVTPEENLNQQKLKKIIKIAQSFLNQRSWQGRRWRVDLIAINMNWKTRKLSIHHIKAIHF